MTAPAARVGIAARDAPATLTAAAFAAWAAVSVAGWYDLVALPRPGVVVAGLVAAAAARLLLVREPLPRPQELVVLVAVVVALALPVAERVEGQAYSLVGVAAAVALGVAIRRHVALAVALLFLLAGFYGSIEAVLGVDPYKPHDALLAAVIVATLLAYLTRGRERRAVPILGAVLFGVYVAITRVYAELASNPVVGADAFYVFGWYMLALLALAYGPWSPATHRRIARALAAGVVLVAGYAVLRWIIGPSDAEREYALDFTRGGPQYNFAEGKLRLFGSFPNTRSLGVWCASVLPFCLALALWFRGRWRLLAIAAGCLAFAALIGSGMRGGLPGAALGCLIVMLVMSFTRAGRGVRVGILAAVAAALVAGFAVVAVVSPDPSVSDRSYARILQPDTDFAYQERLIKWAEAWREAENHPFGQGLGTAGRTAVTGQRFVTIAYFDVDNSYLKVVLDQGIFGLVLFVSALLAIVGGLVRRSLRTVDRQQAALGAAGAGTLAAFMVVMWTGNYVEGLRAFTPWLVAGLGLAQFATVPLRRQR